MLKIFEFSSKTERSYCVDMLDWLVLQQAENDIWNVRLDKGEKGVCCQVMFFLKPTWSESLDRGGKIQQKFQEEREALKRLKEI